MREGGRCSDPDGSSGADWNCTLRSTVEAMGGKLSLVAEFPDRAPVVLSGIGEERTKSSRKRAS